MTEPKKTTKVRVVPERALSLYEGDVLGGRSTLYLSGDELELAADDAAQLVDDGIVELV